MDSNRLEDNGTKSYTPLSLLWSSNDLNLIALAISLSEMKSGSLFLFSSSNPAAINTAIKELASHFKLHNLGPTTFLLGIEIIHNPDKQQISLSQYQYITCGSRPLLAHGSYESKLKSVLSFLFIYI